MTYSECFYDLCISYIVYYVEIKSIIFVIFVTCIFRLLRFAEIHVNYQ